MKVKQTDLDESETPEAVTVVLTIEEAGVLSKLLGTMSSNTWADLLGITHPNNRIYAGAHVYDGLTGGVFNHYWEDGVDGYLRGDLK